jgi:Ser/Thr protein kinase RdoA (MazF antagonist)
MLTFLPRKDLTAVLKRLFPEQRIRVSSMEKGLLNQNHRIQTKTGVFVLKVYRPEVTANELEEMHAVMEFVRAKEIPVATLVDRLEVGTHQVSLYTFLSGSNPSLYSRSLARVAAMGDQLGRIHAALGLYVAERKLKFPNTDPALPTLEEKLQKIERLCEQVNCERPPHSKELLAILKRYAERLTSRSWDVHAFDVLPRHLCHGDFHTKNILFTGDTLSGVLDWEKQGWGGHAFEIMRSIIFNCRRTQASLNWRSVQAYVQAYKQHQTLTALECQLAFPFVFQKMMFGTWAEEQYLKGQHELWSNIQRRHDINEYLFQHEQLFSERMAELLAA